MIQVIKYLPISDANKYVERRLLYGSNSGVATSLAYEVRDVDLSKRGRSLVTWAEDHMPVMLEVQKEFKKEEPMKGVQIGCCLHVTKETAVLVETLVCGGAKVALCGSNPLSTQDPVAATLAKEGVNVYAWRNQSTEEYYRCIEKVLSYKPAITMDDGADLVSTLHTEEHSVEGVLGGTEETTTGVIRLRSMADRGVLEYPVIAVNDADTKHLFDNRYGTGQSTIDGIMRATSLLLAGKGFVVIGYGWCGRGIANRARGMGAHVVVCETDPVKALEATMDGFSVEPLIKAAQHGDFFVTATGNTSVIRKEHIQEMRDGAILANSGHFNVEISVDDLHALTRSRKSVRPNVEKFELKNGRSVYLLAEGRLVNLASAEGHPPEVMMMSFANQALSAEYLVESGQDLVPRVYEVPEYIDRRVARTALKVMGIEIDKLTEKQTEYLKSWEKGTT